MFGNTRYIKHLEATIRALENELHLARGLHRSQLDRLQSKYDKLVERLLAKNGVPSVDVQMRSTKDIDELAIFDDVDPAPRLPEDLVDTRKGDHLDAFAE